jgi:hypothetical protein
MLTLLSFLYEKKVIISPDEEEQIVHHYTNRIRETEKSGEKFGFPELSDEIGYNHQTLRRRIFTRGNYNRIVDRIKSKNSSFVPVEMRFGAGRPKKNITDFASKSEYKSLKSGLKDKELSLRKIKKMYPSASMKKIKHHLEKE